MSEFFKMLYYLPFLVFIFAELYKLNNTKKYLKLIQSSRVGLADKTNEERVEFYKNNKGIIGWVFYTIFAIIWTFLGLFTYNYEFIIIDLLLTFTIFKILFNSKKGASFMNILYKKFDSLYSIIFYLFLILNTYHLHIKLNLFEYIKNLF